MLILFYLLLTLMSVSVSYYFFFFFFNDTAPTEIYTLSLHDALPICLTRHRQIELFHHVTSQNIGNANAELIGRNSDRKSTRLNSSHRCISYAVFCLKKKKKKKKETKNIE